MKKITSTFLTIIALLSLNTQTKAQSTLIYYWDFNGGGTDSAGRRPDYTISGAGSAHFNYWCSYVDFAEGTSLNAQSGYAADSCIRFRNPADSVVFTMPTTGYEHIKFSYAEQRTGSGSAQNTVQFTTDGVTFVSTSTVDGVDSSTYSVDSTDAIVDSSAESWQLVTFSFPDGLVNNNPNFAVAIAFNGVAAATSGNDRFDNITLQGDTYIAEGVASVNSNQAPAYSLYPNPVANTLLINASLSGDKSVSITNVIGQQVYEGAETQQHFSINTSTLNAGLYYVNIRENNSGAISTLKFIKE
jgi:hypothetical protein